MRTRLARGILAFTSEANWSSRVMPLKMVGGKWQMSSHFAEQVEVRTDDYDRPVLFARDCRDFIGEKVVVIDGWARYWELKESRPYTDDETWIVVAQGRAYHLHCLCLSDEVSGQCSELWTAIQYRQQLALPSTYFPCRS